MVSKKPKPLPGLALTLNQSSTPAAVPVPLSDLLAYISASTPKLVRNPPVKIWAGSKVIWLPTRRQATKYLNNFIYTYFENVRIAISKSVSMK
jgi:hypothetical protein